MSNDCKQDPTDASVVIRAREQRDDWGTMQVLECRACETRWSE